MANKGWQALSMQVNTLMDARRSISGCVVVTNTWAKEYGTSWIEAFFAARYKSTQRKDLEARMAEAEKATGILYDRTSKVRVELAKKNSEKRALKEQLAATTKKSKREELFDKIADVENTMDEEIPGKGLRTRYRDLNEKAQEYHTFAQLVQSTFHEINTEILPKYAGQVDDPGSAKGKPLGQHRLLFAVITPEDRAVMDDWIDQLKKLDSKLYELADIVKRGAADQAVEANLSRKERDERELKRLSLRDKSADRPMEVELDGPADLDTIIDKANEQVQTREQKREQREQRRQELETALKPKAPKDMDYNEKRMALIDKEIARLGKAVDEYSNGLLPPNVPFGVVRSPVVLIGPKFSEPALFQLKERGIKVKKLSGNNWSIENAFLFGWSSKVFNEQNGELGSLDPVMILEKIRAKKVDLAKPKAGPAKPGEDEYEKVKNWSGRGTHNNKKAPLEPMKVLKPKKILDSELGVMREEEDSAQARMALEFKLPKGGEGTLVRQLDLRPVSTPKRIGTHSYLILLPAFKGLGRTRERADEVVIDQWDVNTGGGRVAAFLETMATWDL